MIERVACSAPTWPPLTGASRVWMPFWTASAATFCQVTGEMVLMSA